MTERQLVGPSSSRCSRRCGCRPSSRPAGATPRPGTCGSLTISVQPGHGRGVGRGRPDVPDQGRGARVQPGRLAPGRARAGRRGHPRGPAAVRAAARRPGPGAGRASGCRCSRRSWRRWRMDCTCPTWQVPCRHLTATFYALAESFDTDPFGILAWRGRGREELLDRLRVLRSVPSRPKSQHGCRGGFWTRRTAARRPARGPGAAARRRAGPARTAETVRGPARGRSTCCASPTARWRRGTRDRRAEQTDWRPAPARRGATAARRHRAVLQGGGAQPAAVDDEHPGEHRRDTQAQVRHDVQQREQAGPLVRLGGRQHGADGALHGRAEAGAGEHQAREEGPRGRVAIANRQIATPAIRAAMPASSSGVPALRCGPGTRRWRR